jgi:hypothetical protein
VFDLESKIQALTDNYGLMELLAQNDIAEEFVIRFLVDEGMLDLEDIFNTDAEMEYWEERGE